VKENDSCQEDGLTGEAEMTRVAMEVFEALRRTFTEAAPDALPALLGRLEEERLRGENRLTAHVVNGNGRTHGPALDAAANLAVPEVAPGPGISTARLVALRAKFIFAEAVKLPQQRLHDINKNRPTGPDMQQTTMGDMCQMVVDHFIVNKRRSLKRLRGALRHLVGNDEGKGGYFSPTERAVAITEDRITAYITCRLKEGAENGTINRELTALKRMFRLALRARRVSGVPVIDMLAEATSRAGFFEPEVFNAVEGELPDDVRPVARTAYITGWRVASEILSRQWKHIDLNAGFIRLEPGETKNGEGRMFPFTPELRTLLEQQRERTTAIEKATGRIIPWVFHRRGERIASFPKVWKKACAAAGVPERIPHDLRRTAVRNLERAGVPRGDAMKLVGHKTESIYRRYAIADEGSLRAAVEKLAALHTTTDSSYYDINCRV
jgi:integrase